MSEIKSTTELTVERPNSVEISTNAKGDIAFKVKVYEDDPAVAMQKAQELKLRMGAWIETQKAARL